MTESTPVVLEDPEEYCMNNLRVVVMYFNHTTKTWRAACTCLEPVARGHSCRHILCVFQNLDKVRGCYKMELCMLT